MTYRCLGICWMTLAAFVSLGIALSASAAEPERPVPETWSVDPISWQGEIEPGSVVRLSNLHGDLRVRGVDNAGDTRVQIVGFVQHHKADKRQVRVEPRIVPAGSSHGGPGLDFGLELSVEMDDTLMEAEAPQAGAVETMDPTWSARRVDLTIYVPKSAPLVVQTGDGQLWAYDSNARIEATSTSGKMRVSSTGDFLVRNQSGPVSVSLEDEAWQGKGRIETREGDIQVLLLRRSSFELVADLLGRVTTDFSAEIQPTHSGRRTVRVNHSGHSGEGEGRGRIEIESYQGQLSLTELPRGEGRALTPEGAAEAGGETP